MATEITELSSISLALPPSPPQSPESYLNDEDQKSNAKISTVKFAIPSENSNATTETLSTSIMFKDRDSRGSIRIGDRESLRQRRSSKLSTSLLNSFDFVPPDEGTPAAQALAANAAIKVSRVTKGLKKLRGMKRPKMKNLNLVKQLNKKTKRKKKHFSKNFKGKVIDGVHELYTLSAGMMLGIRYSVGKLCGPPGEATENLTIADFSYVEKVTFPPNGSDRNSTHLTPPHQLAHTFKFKSYCPKIFKRLRDFFDTDASSYMLSVCGDYNFIEFISNSKSGQFFFYSHDGKYMIKTQTKEENKFLKRILPHYYKYLTENPYSTLVRIFGMYRVKMYHIRRKVHFVIMVSVFDTPAEIKTIYDLKGSSVGRSVSKEERENGAVLKDNDLLEDGTKLHLGSKKEAFIAQLRKDSHFLASLNIMDYSLLVGIHDRKTRVSAGAGGGTLEAPASAASFSYPELHERLSSHSQGEGEHLSGGIGEEASLTSDDGIDGAESPNFRGGPFAKESAGPQSSPSSISPMSSKRLSIASRSNTPFRRGSLTLPSPQPANPNQEESSSVVKGRRIDSNSSIGLKTAGDDFQNDGRGNGGRGDREGDGEEDGDDEYGEDDDDEEEDAEDDADNDDEFEDIDAGDSGGEEEGRSYHLLNNASSPTHSQRLQLRNSERALDSQAGEGALGEEGYRLSQIFRPSQLRSPNTDISGFASAESARPASKKSAAKNGNDLESAYTLSSTMGPVYSPGITTLKPWTTRVDGGINCRKADGSRGDEIYYIGIIDILQQYNIGKKAETFFKGFTNDVSKLSSIDSVSYAKRFMEFMEKNID